MRGHHDMSDNDDSDGTLIGRHPWRTRSGLLALIDAAAGVLVAAGVQGDIDGWISIATAVVAVLVNVGIVKGGEAKTTPVGDPRADGGAPLVRP